MFVYSFWIFAAVMVCLGKNRVNAILTPEEISAMKDSIEPFVKECLEEFDLTKEKLEKIKDGEHKSDHTPCFVSCVLKKSGIFDSNSKYDFDKDMEITKPLIKNEEEFATIEKAKKDCLKVNDEEVSDEDKGCKRAQLLMNCFLEHKEALSIDQF